LEIVKARAELFEKKKAPMFKVIIIDFNMIEMNGLTAVEKIKESLERCGIEKHQRPIICCCASCYDEPTFRRKDEDSGSYYFIAKPITSDQLTLLLNLLM